MNRGDVVATPGYFKSVRLLEAEPDLTQREIADRLGILADGRLLLDETLEALKARWRKVRAVVAKDEDADGAIAALHAAGVHDVTCTGRVLQGISDAWSDDLGRRLVGQAGLEDVTGEPMALDLIFRSVCNDGGA